MRPAKYSPSMTDKKRRANLSKLIAYLERLQADIEAGKL